MGGKAVSMGAGVYPGRNCVLSPRGLGYLGYVGSVGYFDRLGWASTTKGAGVQPGRCRVLGPRYEVYMAEMHVWR